MGSPGSFRRFQGADTRAAEQALYHIVYIMLYYKRNYIHTYTCKYNLQEAVAGNVSDKASSEEVRRPLLASLGPCVQDEALWFLLENY